MGAVAIPGRLSRMDLSEDGVNWANFDGVVDFNMNVNIDELETTSHDSDGHREYIPNHDDVTMDANARYIENSVAQEMILESALVSKRTFQFRFFMLKADGSGFKMWTGLCFPTTASPSGPLDDTATLDVTLRCSGVQLLRQ